MLCLLQFDCIQALFSIMYFSIDYSAALSNKNLNDALICKRNKKKKEQVLEKFPLEIGEKNTTINNYGKFTS